MQSYTNNYDANGILLQADLRSDCYHPFNPGNVLGYNPTTGKTTGARPQYDPNDPLRKILLAPAPGALYKGTIDPTKQTPTNPATTSTGS